jgi:glycosyltransferase involved in cell wall biosynthesis
MNIVQITPGAGGMYCGNCFRDNALVAALRRRGHQTLMVPLYLPMTLEEDDASAGTPVFYGGINVYLEQRSSLFRKAPNWLRAFLNAPGLLQWASGRAAKTRAADVGDLTVSMLRGEEGNQARELDELITFLRDQPRPDVVCLSNAMLAGLIRRFRNDLGVPVACMLQGEDYFLDELPKEWRDLAWQTLAERVGEADLLIAPSRYYADLMTRRLGLDAGKVRVLHNGIHLDGFSPAPSLPTNPPVLGYFARMCKEKGLDTLVEAYLVIKARNQVENLKLHIGGGCGPGDEPFVQDLIARIQKRGWMQDVQFHPNLSREEKSGFLRGLTVFSVPANYGEAFGLYLPEAWACGVPVVQPRTAAFTELVESTGAGVLYEPNDAQSLATALEHLLIDPKRCRKLGEAGRQAAEKTFNVDAMAARFLQACEQLKRA